MRYLLAVARHVNIESLIARRGPVRDLIALLEANGWTLARQRGSHQTYKHPSIPDIVTIPIHRGGGDTLPPGLLVKILKTARLR